MIFVTLGTQDKSFERLLKAIDKEISKGNIKDRVVVQAGLTKYSSKNMEIFDLIPMDEFDKLMDEADLIITHGGAGSILSAIKKGKTVIAAARLKQYEEHTNDHQIELVSEFSKQGYILELSDFSKLSKVLEKAKNFKPKKYKSNTNNMIKLISDYIEKDNHVSWFNKSLELIKYALFFIILYLVANILREHIFLNKPIYYSMLFGMLVVHYLINKFLVFNNKSKGLLTVFEFILYIFINFMIIVILSNADSLLISVLLIFVISYLCNKFVIFRK